MSLPGPFWETDLFVPSLPSPASLQPPKAPIFALTHLALRSEKNEPIGLDDLNIHPGICLPNSTEVLWRGVVELDARALQWVREDAMERIGGSAAKEHLWREGKVVRVLVQGRWRMSTFDDNFANELQLPPNTDALVFQTRTHRRYHVLSMEAQCYAKSRIALERALIVNFVVMCGVRWPDERQSIPWLVEKYKTMYKSLHTHEAFFTSDIYSALAAHSHFLKTYWQGTRWRNAEYDKRVGVPQKEWDNFYRAVEAKVAALRRMQTPRVCWGRKMQVGQNEGEDLRGRRGVRGSAPAPAAGSGAAGTPSSSAGKRRPSPPREGSAKKRRVDTPVVGPSSAPSSSASAPRPSSSAPPPASIQRRGAGGLFGRPGRSGSGSSTPSVPSAAARKLVASARSRSRPRMIEAIDMTDVVTRTGVVLYNEVLVTNINKRDKERRARGRRSPSPGEGDMEVDLDLTRDSPEAMEDSDDEPEAAEDAEGSGEQEQEEEEEPLTPPAPRRRGRPPKRRVVQTEDVEMEEVDQLEAEWTGEHESLFTPPPPSPKEEDMKPRPRDYWNKAAEEIQPFIPREPRKVKVEPDVVPQIPSCFLYKPVLSPAYTWRCPYPSCTYEMDFLRPSPAFRASLTREEVDIAADVHASCASSRLNGVFYVKVQEHYRMHLKELGVPWAPGAAGKAH